VHKAVKPFEGFLWEISFLSLKALGWIKLNNMVIAK